MTPILQGNGHNLLSDHS